MLWAHTTVGTILTLSLRQPAASPQAPSLSSLSPARPSLRSSASLPAPGAMFALSLCRALASGRHLPQVFPFLVNALFMLPCCRPTASELHIPTLPLPGSRAPGYCSEVSLTYLLHIKALIFRAIAKGTSLDHLALEARRACIPGSLGQ